MEIWLDTANVDEIREAGSWGILTGVTTNPTLASRENRTFREMIEEIASIVDGPVSAECVTSTAEELVPEARDLAQIAENIVVKIPMTVEGLKAVSVVSKEGIKVNTTLIFSANQALLAAKAGAAYVSPFIGRIDDINEDGIESLSNITTIFANYGVDSKIIAASIRHPLHVMQAALVGADIATVPFAVLEKMTQHPLTDRGIEKFLADWEKVPKA